MPKAMAQFRTLLGPADAVLPPPASAEQRRSMADLGVMVQEMRAASFAQHAAWNSRGQSAAAAGLRPEAAARRLTLNRL
jgi:hypothetical protein